MPSRNRVELIGHLGSRPQLRYTASGVPVTTFSVATNERWRAKDGTDHEQTEWHRIVVWQRSAETAAEFLQKGSLVSVEGALRTRDWTDSDGAKRVTTEIHARPGGLLFLDRRPGAPAGNRSPEKEPTPPEELPDLPSLAGTDDDIPF